VSFVKQNNKYYIPIVTTIVCNNYKGELKMRTYQIKNRKDNEFKPWLLITYENGEWYDQRGFMVNEFDRAQMFGTCWEIHGQEIF